MRLVHLEQSLTYDGRQLGTAFVDCHAPGGGDALLLFEGPADVPVEHMVDLEDADAGDIIWSPWMAHVILEHRGLDLHAGVLAQRLLVRIMGDWIGRRVGCFPEVSGDDLYVDERKLSVSIATTSPRGVLVHTAINVRTEGAPVPAAGLAELRLPAREFLAAVGRAYVEEMASVEHAVGKVRGVS